MAVAIKLPAIYTAVDRISAPLRRMGAASRKFAQKMETGVARANRAFRRLTPSISAASRQLLQFVSITAGLLLLREGFRTIQTYETGLVAVGKTADIAGKQLQRFGKEVVDLSTATPGISTEKLLEMATVAGQLGVKGSNNILKFSDTLARLELATDVVGEEGAKSIARILNITGEATKTVDQFGAALVALGNNAAASESEILSMATEVGKATATFGLVSTEILGISTGLVALGARPEAAGTAVGKFFAQVEIASFKGGRKLTRFSKILGVQEKEVKRLFAEDKSKLFAKFAEGLSKVQARGGSVRDAMAKLGLTGERVVKTLGPLGNASDKVAASLKLSAIAYQENTALQIEAEKAMATVSSAVNALKQRWDNLLVSVTSSNDGFSLFRKIIMFVTNNLETLVKAVLIYIVVMTAMKLLIVATRVILIGYNIVLGISAAMHGRLTKAVAINKFALGAYATVTKIATAAQWLLNAAMLANPIGLIIVGAIAMIALITAIIVKWEKWGAAVSLLLGPIGLLIGLVMSFRRHWQGIKDAFTDGGILAGLKKIGAVLIDAILFPVQQLLQLMSRLPGLGKLAGRGAEGINAARERLGINTETTSPGPKVPAAVTAATSAIDGVAPLLNSTNRDNRQNIVPANVNQARDERTEAQAIQQAAAHRLRIDVNDPTKLVNVTDQGGDFQTDIRPVSTLFGNYSNDG